MPTSPAATLLAAGAVLVALLAGCTSPDAAPPATDGTSTAPPPEPTGSPSPSSTAPSSTDPDRSPGSTPKDPAALNRALIAATWDNDAARARRLIRDGADVNHQDDTQQSAYLIAASEGYVDLLDLTLRHGARINAKDSYNGTALIRAAERGHADIVGRLVQAGIDLDHVNELGWTALHEAVILGDGTANALRTVRALVAAGVDVTVPTGRDGQTAEQHARTRGYDAIASLLSQANAPVDAPDRALLDAAARGDADTAARALRAGAGIEARDGERRTPLLRAVTGDHLEVARVLVWLGADPDALDAQHDTPWLVTGVTGGVAMAELLLTVDPDLGILNRYGGTSIIPASERGHVDYVRRVARTDIDLDHVNDLGWTALLEAVILGEGTARWQRIVRILLQNGADAGIADAQGMTPLQHARSRGDREIARILADHDG